MRIAIALKDEENIVTVKDYSNIQNKGQISHFLAELECIKQDLIEFWKEWNDYDEEEGVSNSS